MMFLLDTNAWITDLRSRGQSKLSRRLRATPPSQLAGCSIVRAVLMVGALKSPNPVAELAAIRGLFSHLKRSFTFNDAAADEYARIRGDLERRGLPIGGNDYIIAAIAVANHLTLVTHNVGEFSRVSGLAIDDWQ